MRWTERRGTGPTGGPPPRPVSVASAIPAALEGSASGYSSLGSRLIQSVAPSFYNTLPGCQGLETAGESDPGFRSE